MGDAHSYATGMSPCRKILGVPLHLLLCSRLVTKHWEGPWHPTVVSCKQEEGQQDEGTLPGVTHLLSQGQHVPPSSGLVQFHSGLPALVRLR